MPFSISLKLLSTNSFSLEESKTCHLIKGELLSSSKGLNKFVLQRYTEVYGDVDYLTLHVENSFTSVAYLLVM